MTEKRALPAAQTITGINITHAAQLLARGEVVAIPTETVYGLAANAYDTKAVERIFAMKGRPLSNPMIVHVASIEQARTFTINIPEPALQLLDIFSPGPLTILLPKNNLIPNLVTAGLPDVAVRIPDHPVTRALLNETGFPLAAPSANPSGSTSPTTAGHVAKMLDGKLGYILDGGACSNGIESTIVGFPKGIPTILRPGTITKNAIELVIGPVSEKVGSQLLAPGMLPVHYAPRTTMILTNDVDAVLQQYKESMIGVITYNKYSALIPAERQILISSNNDILTAARNLYAAMHDMDERNYDLIVTRRLPDHGIGIAVNDRLTRASKNR